MMNIEDLLMSLRSDEISKVYTYSTHSIIVREIMNKVIDQYPEYKNIIRLLAVYPVQSWAVIQRKEIGITSSDIMKTIKIAGEYFGIHNLESIKNQFESQLLTDKLFMKLYDCLNKSKKLDTFISIHSLTHDDDKTSRYKVINYYKDQLLQFCSKYYKSIDKEMKDLYNVIQEMDEDIAFVYHDADMFVQLLKELKRKEYLLDTNVNKEELMDTIEKCVNSLKTYPFNGYDIFTIINLYINGTKEYIIAKTMKKSRTYVRNRYEEGVEALASLIWGYTNCNIFN